jgi:hypothetical protein
MFPHCATPPGRSRDTFPACVDEDVEDEEAHHCPDRRAGPVLEPPIVSMPLRSSRSCSDHISRKASQPGGLTEEVVFGQPLQVGPDLRFHPLRIARFPRRYRHLRTVSRDGRRRSWTSDPALRPAARTRADCSNKGSGPRRRARDRFFLLIPKTVVRTPPEPMGASDGMLKRK